jgi:diacylglycerol O-acyltransferase-1
MLTEEELGAGMEVGVDEHGMQILLMQNSQLEEEVTRLCGELDEISKGVLKRGYLHKQRERNISFSSNWGLRYFELIGATLSYFQDDRDRRPRRSINVSECTVVNEGMKKNTFYVFSVQLEGSVIIRLSSDNKAEAIQWMRLIQHAGTIHDEKKQSLFTNEDDLHDTLDIKEEDLKKLNSFAQKRVHSSSLVLAKSKSFGSTLALNDEAFLKEQELLMSKSNGKKNLPPAKDKEKSAYSEFPASMPIHCESQSSPLSSDVNQSQQNYRGFFNLGLIILFLSHCRQIVDNMHSHGIIVSLPSLSFDDRGYESLVRISRVCLEALAFWAISTTLSFSVEVLAIRLHIKERYILVANILLGAVNIFVPSLWVWRTQAHPIMSMIFLSQSVIIWMKLISYAHVNRDMRRSIRAAKKAADNDEYNNAKPQNIYITNVKNLSMPVVGYPQNITVSNLGFFLIVPTLCYQLNYPRTPRIRWNYAATLVIRLLVCVGMMTIGFEQYIVPTLQTSVMAVKERNFVAIVQGLLKLAIPNTYIWLLMFYSFFHVWMNLLAEVTRFGDRLFYKGQQLVSIHFFYRTTTVTTASPHSLFYLFVDWWNARTIDIYWRNWNMPVHSWCLRHLYHPLLRGGAPKTVATLAVFFFSAAMHEVIISIPFRHFGFQAFFGMLAQAPLVYITRHIDRIIDSAFVGNVFFWCTFCVVGQPMGIVLYYYDLWKIASENAV